MQKDNIFINFFNFICQVSRPDFSQTIESTLRESSIVNSYFLFQPVLYFCHFNQHLIDTLFTTYVMNKVSIIPKNSSFLLRQTILNTQRTPAYPRIRQFRFSPQRSGALPQVRLHLLPICCCQVRTNKFYSSFLLNTPTNLVVSFSTSGKTLSCGRLHGLKTHWAFLQIGSVAFPNNS